MILDLAENPAAGAAVIDWDWFHIVLTLLCIEGRRHYTRKDLVYLLLVCETRCNHTHSENFYH